MARGLQWSPTVLDLRGTYCGKTACFSAQSMATKLLVCTCLWVKCTAWIIMLAISSGGTPETTTPPASLREHEYIACFAKDANTTEPVWKNDFSDPKELLLQQWEQWKSDELSVDERQQTLRVFIKDMPKCLPRLIGTGLSMKAAFTPDRRAFTTRTRMDTSTTSFTLTRESPCGCPQMATDVLKRRCSEDFIEKGRLIYGPDEHRIVQIKLYLRDYKDSLVAYSNSMEDLEPMLLNALFGKGTDVFDIPKTAAIDEAANLVR